MGATFNTSPCPFVLSTLTPFALSTLAPLGLSLSKPLHGVARALRQAQCERTWGRRGKTHTLARCERI